MNPRSLFNQGKISECYEVLINEPPHDIEELKLIYECEKLLRLHQFDKWPANLLFEQLNSVELYQLYNESISFLDPNSKILILKRIESLGNIYYCMNEVLIDLSRSLEEKKHHRFIRLSLEFKSLLESHLHYQILNLNHKLLLEDEEEIDRIATKLVSFLPMKWKKFRGDECLCKDMRETIELIDAVKELSQSNIYGLLQIIKLEIYLHLGIKMDRESFLRSAVFFVEDEKMWNKYWKNTRVKNEYNQGEDVGRKPTLYNLEAASEERRSETQEKLIYKESQDEINIRHRIKYNDEGIIDQSEYFIRAFYDLGYYQATRDLCENIQEIDRLEYLSSLWHMNDHIGVIDAFEKSKQKKNLDFLYLKGKSLQCLGKKEQAIKAFSEILALNANYKDVKDLVFNV